MLCVELNLTRSTHALNPAAGPGSAPADANAETLSGSRVGDMARPQKQKRPGSSKLPGRRSGTRVVDEGLEPSTSRM